MNIPKKEDRKHGSLLFPVNAYEEGENPNEAKLFECHWHSEWEILKIHKGIATLTISGMKLIANEGDVILIPKGCLHVGEKYNCEELIYRAFVFSQEFLRSEQDIVQTKYLDSIFCEENQAHILFAKDNRGAEAKELFEKIFTTFKLKKFCYELLIKAYLYEFFAFVFEGSGLKAIQTNINQNKIKEVVEYMKSHYNEPLTIRQLAKMANMSDGYFIKSFGVNLSKSPTVYLRDIRLKKAAEMLLKTDELILRIAYDSGFNNIGYFIRCFENKFGCSPKNYRNNTKFQKA